jgi:flagellar hook-length control protein FliK
VLVRFGEQNGQIQGVLEVTRGQTRHEVEQALPEVLRNLQDLGIHVRRLDVTVCDQSGEDPGGQQLQQDAWPQREGSDRYARPSNLDGRSSDFESEKAGVPASISVPAGRIDMLV